VIREKQVPVVQCSSCWRLKVVPRLYRLRLHCILKLLNLHLGVQNLQFFRHLSKIGLFISLFRCYNRENGSKSAATGPESPHSLGAANGPGEDRREHISVDCWSTLWSEHQQEWRSATQSFRGTCLCTGCVRGFENRQEQHVDPCMEN
jgi:hypothetical protein